MTRRSDLSLDMRRTCSNMIVLLLICAIAFCTFGCGEKSPPNSDAREAQPDTQLKVQPIKAEDRIITEGSVIDVAQKLIPSVVGISTIETTRQYLWSEPNITRGVGSGVIVHSDGYILTNDHVAGGNPSNINVIFRNGDELQGKTLWADPTLDLAMVKVDATDLNVAPIGDSDNLLVGETAIAIGTPLGLQFQHTVTSGIISALNRTVQVPTNLGENFMEDLIQTDASINPGNSGGPLVNTMGEIIGINTIKVSSAESIGFAIPINVAKPIIKHFVEEGSFITPYIGIVGFDREMASYHNRNAYIQEGVYVVELDSRGPAHHAGIRVDDIITMVGGEPVSKMLDLRKAIYAYRVGQSVDISIIRKGHEIVVSMELIEKPV
ncbi:MAG TPA: trypsin-like peptidase domain-containing protein [Clostridia bacterium]|nr:trypsin-like peptidase domain-containing protein [Clostridia bacterium]